ncbi:MAG: ferritin family protein [Elusimicrobiota bacterium]
MNKLKEIMRTAVQMEKDGIKYYRQAADKINNDVAKKMFDFLIEDEKRHIEKWKEIFEETEIEGVGKEEAKKTSEKIKTIFSSIPEEVKEKLKSSSDEAKVLNGAISMEDKGIKYYSQQAEELQGKASKLCKLIVIEEKSHRDMLQNTLEYILSNWQWNVDTENWMFEG